MELYYAYYKRQHFNVKSGKWEDTFYNHQGIVVVAENFETAKEKVERCIQVAGGGEFRAVLTGNIIKCIGLDMRELFDGDFSVSPISYEKVGL